MKKLICALMAIAMIMSLAACGSKANSSSSASADTSADTSEMASESSSSSESDYDPQSDWMVLIGADDYAKFQELCTVEKNCADMSTEKLAQHPESFDENTLIRIPGEIVGVNGSNYLVHCYDSSGCTADCYFTITVDGYTCYEGDKVCAYGYPSGIGGYTLTDGNGNDESHSCLSLDCKYLVNQDDTNGTGNTELESWEQDLIYGTYQVNDTENPQYYVDKTMKIDASTYNGRPYTVNWVRQSFTTVPSVYFGLSQVYFCEMQIATTDDRGDAITIAFRTYLDGTNALASVTLGNNPIPCNAHFTKTSA